LHVTQLGAPCSAMYEDASNAQITMFGTENATLPTNHTYTDLEGRTVTNPLPVASSDAWELTTGGNGCS